MKTGNKTKVAALDKVLGVCNALGPGYNPSNASLKPTAMKALLELAREKQKAVIVTRTAYAMAVNDRAEAFAGIPKLAVQIARIANASEPSSEDREEVQRIKRKFFTTGRKKKSDIISSGEASSDQVSKRTRSASNASKLDVMETLQTLIQVVQSIAGYKPNEPEFKVETLKAKLADLQSKCNAVAQTSIAYSNAQIARDLVMLGKDGVEDTTRNSMDYIRGKFGVRSLQSHKVSIQASSF